MASDFAEIRAHFPIMQEATYLNCAAVGPMPDFLASTYQQAVMDRMHVATTDVVARARRAVTDYLGVPEPSLSLWTNTTQGINVVAGSIDWQPGDEVIVNDIDFPSNLIPWIRLAERGVVVKPARSEAGRLPPQTILDLVTPRTRLVAVSHVFYQTGYRMDLVKLGQALHERGVLLSVDGIQALGLMVPPLEHVDFYMGASFKHLLGPRGLGLLYVNPEVAERLTPAMVGYASVTGTSEDWWRDRISYRPGAGRFQLAHVNSEGMYAMLALMTFFGTIGWQHITNRVQALSGLAISELSAVAGVRVITPVDPAERLSLAVFQKEGVDADRMVAHLADRHIICAAREGNVRAAFHIYNDESDVERLVAAVRDVAPASAP